MLRGTIGALVTGTAQDQLAGWLEDARGSAPAGVVVLTAAGAVAASNSAALEMLECSGTNGLRALLQPLLKRLASQVAAPADGSAQEFELQVRTPSRARRIAVRAHALSGEQLHWLLLLRSDPDAVAVEDALQNAARSQLLQRLHGTLRHDLNSPIQSIVWTIDLVQRAVEQSQLPPQQGSQLQQSVALARKEIVRLKGAVRRLLSFAIPAIDERERVDLNQLATEAQRLVATEAALFEMPMALELCDQPLFVEGVRGQLEQALAALLLNAIDALPNGGAITVAVRERDRVAELVVSCEPRADAGRATHVDDVAPGAAARGAVDLHGTQAIVAAHGGDVSEQSSGGARTFRLRLPLARPRGV